MRDERIAKSSKSKRRMSKSDDGTEASEHAEVPVRKGIKVSSRVHRACNPCRKQKIRCEGPGDGPCNRCQATSQNCVFEKPEKSNSTVNANLGSAGLDSLQTLGNQISGMQTLLFQLVSSLQNHSNGFHSVENSSHLPPHPLQTQSPEWREPIPHTFSNASPFGPDPHANAMQNLQDGRVSEEAMKSRIESIGSQRGKLQSFGSHQEELHSDVSLLAPPKPPPPPFSVGRSYEDHSGEGGEESTDKEPDFTNDELGAPITALRGLADAAVSRRPADTAMTNKVEYNGYANEKEGPRKEKGSVEDHQKDMPLADKSHACARDDKKPVNAGLPLSIDLVSAGVINIADARRSWRIFSKGCPKFVGVFSLGDRTLNSSDQNGLEDTEEWFEIVRRESPFLFATILAVGSKVGLSFGCDAKVAQQCMGVAQAHAQETLFRPAPALRKEDVTALNLLASYCDSGWVICGHAVRIAQEQRLDMDFDRLQYLVSRNPSLLQHSNSTLEEDHLDGKHIQDLARGSRIWFFCFLLEHQISYGAGRPAMLTHNLVKNCREFLNLREPLSLPIDVRYISTLELMVIRERYHFCLSPFDSPINKTMYDRVLRLNEDLAQWLEFWTLEFKKRGYSEDTFYVGSLRLQCATAKLYLTCTVLRKVHEGPVTWNNIGGNHRNLLLQAVKAADQTLKIAVHHKEYFALLTWAPHYTIVTATFSAVFLLKALRLYPSSQLITTRGLQEIFENAEKLAKRFKQLPSAQKYGAVILRMLWHAFKFIVGINRKRGLSVIFGSNSKSRPHRPSVSLTDDTNSTRSGGDDNDNGDSDSRAFDAAIAEIDWDAMNEGDYRQLIYRLEPSMHNQQPLNTPQCPPLPLQSEGPKSSLPDQWHFGNGSSQSNFEALSSAMSSRNETPSVTTPLRLPAWVQPVTFEDGLGEWNAASYPSSGENQNVHSSYGQQSQFSNGSTTDQLQGRIFSSSLGTSRQRVLPSSDMSHSIPTPSQHTSYPLTNDPQYNTFDQIAHELDLNDTLADLFATDPIQSQSNFQKAEEPHADVALSSPVSNLSNVLSASIETPHPPASS